MINKEFYEEDIIDDVVNQNTGIDNDEIEDTEDIDDEAAYEEDTVIDDEEDDIEAYNEEELLIKVLDRELKKIEVDRSSLTFKILGSQNIYEGIPIAKLTDSYIFKINNNLKKIKVKDIVLS